MFYITLLFVLGIIGYCIASGWAGLLFYILVGLVTSLYFLPKTVKIYRSVYNLYNEEQTLAGLIVYIVVLGMIDSILWPWPVLMEARGKSS